jgi:hypothetical protein
MDCKGAQGVPAAGRAAYSEEDLVSKRRFAWTGSTSVGSYAVSATTSHYDWARTLIRRFARTH